MVCGIGFSAVNETRHSHTVAALHDTDKPSMATHILHVYCAASCAQALAQHQRGMHGGATYVCKKYGKQFNWGSSMRAYSMLTLENTVTY